MRVFLLIGLVILSGCANVSDLGECSRDSECVKAECCHANSCVVSEEAPDCNGVFCTMNCEPGTLDCGQGSCGCVNGKCEAVIE